MTFFIGQIFNGTYPPDAAVWCNRNGAYIEAVDGGYQIVGIPESTLDEVKREKIAELKETRDTLEVESIIVGGHIYDYDDKARERIHAAIVALDGTERSLSWTTADQQEAVVDAEGLKNIVRAAAVRSNALHVMYRDLKAQVEAATTTEDVEMIAWK